MSSDPPIVAWSSDSGIDPTAVRWRASSVMITSSPIGPGPDYALLPPRPQDGVWHFVELESGRDPAVVIAMVPDAELAGHIAEVHNAQLDANSA
jgi:hypothetical protein